MATVDYKPTRTKYPYNSDRQGKQTHIVEKTTFKAKNMIFLNVAIKVLYLIEFPFKSPSF